MIDFIRTMYRGITGTTVFKALMFRKEVVENNAEILMVCMTWIGLIAVFIGGVIMVYVCLHLNPIATISIIVFPIGFIICSLCLAQIVTWIRRKNE